MSKKVQQAMKAEMERINASVIGAESDLEKFLNGNAVAAARVRKYMQEIKKSAQNLRVMVQEKKVKDQKKKK